MSLKIFDIKALIKELEKIPELTTKIYWMFDDEIDDDEKPDKPYIFISVISDIPDPIETVCSLEFRIITPDDKTNKQKLREIDKILMEKLPEIHNFNWEFEVRNIVIQDGLIMDEPKGRKSMIRDYIFYFIN